MSQKWNYNNMEFEVDLQDADFAERYEAAFERMALDEKKVQKAENCNSCAGVDSLLPARIHYSVKNR